MIFHEQHSVYLRTNNCRNILAIWIAKVHKCAQREHRDAKLMLQDKLFCWHNERSFVSCIRVA